MPTSRPSAARFLLLAAQVVVAELVERQPHGRLVVARVVHEARGRLVRELVGADEVLQAQLGGVDAELVGGRLHEPLDQVGRLRDPERAAVGHAAGRLVRVGAVRLHVRDRDVIGAGHDVEQARLALRRLGVGEEGAVVGEQLHAQSGHPVALHRQLALHVVVPGEARGDQVAGAVLDPLDRLSDQERGGRGHHVAGVDRHLVAEAAADVGRDDPDLVLGQPGHHREQRAVRVRCLRGHVDRGLAGGGVHVRHAAAALERRRMAARIVRLELDHPVGLRERRFGGRAVARLPVVDVVRVLALLVVPDHRRVRLERLLRRRHRVERLVVDHDQLEGVLGRVGVLRHHGGDLLALEAHLVRGEHGLRVAGERGHPGEPVLGHQLARDHGHDARQRRRRGGVDGGDPGVREGGAQQLEVEHAGQRHVVDVVAAAADEARVLLALDGVADPADLGRGLHRYSSPRRAAAACCTALTMF